MPIFGSPPIESQGGAVASQYWRAPASAWTSSDPVLGLNEIGQETDTLKYKVGDGVTAWSSLSYAGLVGPEGEDGYTPIKGVDYFDGEDGADSTVPGPKGDDGYTPVKGVDYFDGAKGDKGDTGDTGTTTWAGITDKPTVFTPDTHGHAPSEITGTAVVDNDARLSDARTPTSHSHSPSDVTGTAVITNDSRLSDARTPTAHDQAISTVTGLQTALDGKSATGHGHVIADTTNLQTTLDGKSSTGHDHTGTYEPANANIQTHVTSAHAPSDAQKNSDITKAEIEAKLTGAITTHTHSGGSSLLEVPWHADATAAFALTNSPLAERIVLAQPTRMCKLCPLTGFTQVRMVGVQSVTSTSGSTPKITLKYKTGAYSATLGDYGAIGEASVELSLTGTGAKDTGWINLVSGAKADVWVTLTEKGGDGALDPAFGHLTVYFK